MAFFLAAVIAAYPLRRLLNRIFADILEYALRFTQGTF